MKIIQNPIYSVFLFSIFWVALMFHDNILNLNGFVFSSDGDGIKNYFSILNHVKNDAEYWQTEGMNYPYGEVIVYTDGQPAIANFLKILSSVFPEINNYLIGVLNFLMLSSIPIGAIFLFKTFKKLNLNSIASFLGVIIFCALQPQLPRMAGHYGLAYASVIPISLYLLTSFSLNRKQKNLILLFIHALLFFFIHPYMGLLLSIFHLVFLTFTLLQQETLKSIWRKAWQPLFLILPAILFQVFLKLIDHHEGRVSSPDGFYNFTASLHSFFQPHASWAKSLFLLFAYEKKISWETLSYLGIANIVMLMLSPVVLFLSIKKEKEKLVQLIPFLLSGFALFLFAMGHPLHWETPPVAEIFPSLKQFRVLGRFGWLVFYVSTTLTVFLTHFILSKNKALGCSIASILAILSLIEGNHSNQIIAQAINQQPNSFIYQNLDPQQQELIDVIDSIHPQAIYTIPFNSIGGWEHQKVGDMYTLAQTQVLSYHTGIPMFGGSLSRTSETEAINGIKLMGTPLVEKNILPLLVEQPIALINWNRKISKREQYWLEQSTQVFENGKVNVHLIYPSDFKPKHFNLLHDSLDSTLLNSSSIAILDTQKFVYLNTCDTNVNSVFIHNRKALKVKTKEYTNLALLEAGTLQSGKQYSCSFWTNTAKPSMAFETFGILKTDTTGVYSWINLTDTRKSQEIHKNWTLNEFDFTVPDTSSTYTLTVSGNSHFEHAYFDNILIIEKGQKVLQKKSTHQPRMLNNVIF